MRYSIVNATPQEVQAVGGTSIKVLKATGVVFAQLTPAQSQALKDAGCIVEPVGDVKVNITPPVAPPVPVAGAPTFTAGEYVRIAGMDTLREMFTPAMYGQGYNIAIIGTGIRHTHEAINGRVVYSHNYTSSPDGDGFDHDTGVASIALSMAPEAGLLDLKVLNDNGEGTEEELAEAIDDCIDLHQQGSEFAPSVINLSLGGADTNDPNNIMRVMCRVAIENGIWIASAAGNGGPNPGTIMSPACEQYVVAVGSIKYLADEQSFIVSDFSSRGPTLEGLVKPDVVFFGEDMLMASSASDTATVAKSGTSFACPFGAGSAIIIREGLARQALPTTPIPGITPEESWYFSLKDLIDINIPLVSIKPEGIAKPKDNDYGCGLPFGPAIVNLMQPSAVLMSSMVGMVMVMGIMGMMVKMVKGEKK